MAQLLKVAGCQMEENVHKGGYVPVCDAYGETSLQGVFVAGDVSGVEEASSAMIEGRIAGIAAAGYLGFVDQDERTNKVQELEGALRCLRQGMFALENRGKIIEKTDEGYDVSGHLLRKGFFEDEEVTKYPGVTRQQGIHAVIECAQNIPCNPCQDACPMNCIKIGENITSLPVVDETAACSGCGLCVAACPGQAIFLVNEDYEQGYASITLPYEFLPLPQKGDTGWALGRSGEKVCMAEVVNVNTSPAFDRTSLLTIKVPAQMAMTARFFKGGSCHA